MLEKKINVRRYNGERDKAGVEELERRCGVGPQGKMCFFMDTLGDPICRIRNAPLYTMLVAEVDDHELVGIIQGTIKLVTLSEALATVGYVLGLRVVPLSRRGGIGSTLVRHMEQWFMANQVDYAYMATEKHNHPSLTLFVDRLGYTIFKTPSILVHPVSHDSVDGSRRSAGVDLAMLKPERAEFLYRKHMASTDFFPHDIDRVLNHKLSLGTWVSYYRRRSSGTADHHVSFSGDESAESWAMLSVWNGGDVYKLRAGEVLTFPCFVYSRSSRLMNWAFPCFSVQEMPDFSENFGFYFVYGLFRRGQGSGKLVRALFRHVNNVAKEKGDCKVIVTEVGRMEEGLRSHIPHWKLLSGSEDFWCIKSLKIDGEEEGTTRMRSIILSKSVEPKRGLFVDPREV